MNNQPQTIIIVDVKGIIEKYEHMSTVATKLPWIDVQTVLAIGLSQPPGPCTSEDNLSLIEKIIIAKGAEFLIPGDFFDVVEGLLDSAVEDVDGLVRYYGQTRPIDLLNVTFLKWIDYHTLALGCYYGPNTTINDHYRASRGAALSYISQTTGISFQ